MPKTLAVYFTEYSELEGTLKDHQIQLLSEWAVQNQNPCGVITTML